mmetsp:Transcript_100294/g.259077  ORF Transcript_100294/g.259077 Transcript_100294/m.259077 type:complete len:597 (+) Transcript_100294:19-1809(+)
MEAPGPGVWVRIPNNEPHESCEDEEERRHYFWNPATQATLWRLPDGAAATWAASRTPEGTYYWNLRTRRTTWEIPTDEFGTGAGAGCAGAPFAEGGWQFEYMYPPEAERARGSPAAPGDAQDPAQDGWLGEDNGGASWVEVYLKDKDQWAGRPYYWNFRRGLSTKALPPGTRAQWRSFEPDGPAAEARWHYMDVDTGRAVWVVPGMPLDDREAAAAQRSELPIWRWLKVGSAVAVCGLQTDERFNGQKGQVVGFQQGRVVVKLPNCLGAPQLALLPDNLEPLCPAAIVQVTGLRGRPECNEQIATVEQWDPQNCRYMIQMCHGGREMIKVRGENVKAKSQIWETDFRLDQSFSYLQWRKEQTLLFIDSERQHRMFSLSLPLNFATYQQQAASEGRQVAWPVIVYMHGTGGNNFFSHSRKSLKSVGLQYAAAKFVVVSPHCDWNWREVPRSWVTELVQTLRAADWCDHNRIYLSGCSMGGMSTWELGAARPELYAAIAPVAGHHQADRAMFLAEQLRSTPTCVVHSSVDGTCPLRNEQPLWTKLADLGNKNLEIHMSQTIDHCSMYERTYCDTTTLYDWLLQYRRTARTRSAGREVY